MKLLKFFTSKIFLLNIIISVVISVLLVLTIIKSLHSFTNQDQKIKVPDLTGLTLEEVKIVLEDLKLKYEFLELGAYNPNIPSKTVLLQDPLVGAIVKEKRKIYVTINPERYAKASIPSFYGKTKKEIVQLITNSGFKIGSYKEINDIGTVVRGLKHKGKKLKAGDMLLKMSVIDIVIGNGQLK